MIELFQCLISFYAKNTRNAPGYGGVRNVKMMKNVPNPGGVYVPEKEKKCSQPWWGKISKMYPTLVGYTCQKKRKNAPNSGGGKKHRPHLHYDAWR
jgi:hypothetical protein